MKSLIRNLLIGQKRITSRIEYKYAMLRGEFALIILFVGIFYILLDTFNHVTVFIPLYGVLILFGLVALQLNRAGRYNAATVVILVLINSLIFLFADVDHPRGGVFFFFVTSSIAGYILMNYYPSRLAILFAFLPLGLGYIAYLNDFNFIAHPSYDNSIVKINFLANFSMGLVSCIFIVQFLISRNRESEMFLLASQERIKKTSEELAASEERFAMALKGTRAGIYEWDVQLNKVYVSDYYKALLGLDEADSNNFTLESFIALVHPEDKSRTAQSVTFSLNTQQPYQNEVRLKMKDGSFNWFLDSGIFKSDEKGMPRRVVGSIIDIEERKQGEQKILQQNELLAKTNKELDYFVYSVSHDLRAPLSSILGLTNIYNMAALPGEKESIIEMINERAHALDLFIREVLDYSRNARVEIKTSPVNVREVVEEVIRGLEHMKGIEQLTMEMDIPEDHVIITDRERLKVTLSNLIGNAINYRDTGKQSFIGVRSEVKEGQWILSIKDNGIGIRKEHQERIFEMFYKAHEHGHGTGLGLYIVKETLQKLGGEINVDSEYGVGSTFKVTILQQTPVPVEN